MQIISRMKNSNTYCKTTIKLMVIYAIQSICGGIAFYISLFLKSKTGLDALHISILVSATSMGNIIGSYTGGYISDKFNPSYALKTGLALQGFALLSLVFMTNFYAIFLIMTIMGTGSYLYITSSIYILNSKFDNSQENRAKIISDQNIIANIGMFFAAILMGYCAAGYYSPIFISVALLMIIIAITLEPFDKTFYSINIHDNHNDNHKRGNTSFYIVGLLAIGLIGMMYSQHRIAYPIFLESKFGNINTGYLMSLNPLIILFFQSFIIKQSSKLNEVLVLGIGLLFFGISFFILNYPININMIFLSCVILTLGEILAITYAQSIAFGYAPVRMRGRVLGLYKSIYSFTKIIGAYIAGVLTNYTSYTVLWSFCGLLGVIGFLITLLMILNTKFSFFKLKIIYEKLS